MAEPYIPVNWDNVFMVAPLPNVLLDEYQLINHVRYSRMYPQILNDERIRRQILEYELTLHPDKKQEETIHQPIQ